MSDGACCVAPTGIEVYRGSAASRMAKRPVHVRLQQRRRCYHFYLSGDRTQVIAEAVVSGVTCNMDIAPGRTGRSIISRAAAIARGPCTASPAAPGRRRPRRSYPAPRRRRPARRSPPVAPPPARCNSTTCRRAAPSTTLSAAWPAGASSAAIPAAARVSRSAAPTSAPATTSRAARCQDRRPTPPASPTRSRPPSRRSRMCRRPTVLALDRAAGRARLHQRLPLRRAVRAVHRRRPTAPTSAPTTTSPAASSPRLTPMPPATPKRRPAADIRGCAAGQPVLSLRRAAWPAGASSAAIPAAAPGEPCVAPGNRPYFRPGNNVTRGQTAKIVANTFFPGCSTPTQLRVGVRG